jgi:HAD superfamily hydrolase (TIGR01509 family)
MQRALIFDYGGVVMKTVDYGPRHRWDDRLGLPHGSVERVVHGSPAWIGAMTGQVSLDAYWADVARQLRLDADQVRQLAADFYSGDQLDTALIAYLRRLRARGHTVALLSNASPALAGELDELGISGLFNPLVISAFIGVLKPDAGAYYAVLNRINRPPHETVFIDDMAANVAAARTLGIHAVQYRAGLDLPAVIEPLLTA